MADVNVQFANGVVTVSPMQTPMHGPGAITFHKVPANATWSITSVNGLAGWQQNPGNSGVYVVHDPYSSPLQSYPYTVTITDADGGTHTGPSQITNTDPPIIMNEV